MLGVWLKPSLQWNHQFKIVHEKMIVSTKKLVNTDLKASLVYLYFHCYIIKNVFFGYGIASFTPPEEEELKKIYEQPILEKLRLGMKFSKCALYIYKKALGISIMTPNTMLAILALKLYFGHTRLQGETNDIIEYNLERLKIEIGRNIALEDIPILEKYWNRT